jgi:hypothetical protein
MGIPSLPNSRSHTPSHSPRCPAAFAKSACGSNPSPRAYLIAPNTIRAIRIGDVDALQRVVTVQAIRDLMVAAGEQIDGLYPLGERWRPAYEVWLAERKP